METISERNFKALTNSELGERKAGVILTNRFTRVEQINSIIDYMLNDSIPVEVKTCQVKIKTGQENYPERTGRFILFPEQHKHLILNSGYYLFIVKKDRFIHAWKMLPAEAINYRRHVQWDKIIERK